MLVSRGTLSGFVVGVLCSSGLLMAPTALGQTVAPAMFGSTPMIDSPADCPPSPQVGPAEPTVSSPLPTQEPTVSDTRGTFQICGSGDAQLERAIERLIAGRSFSVTLQSSGNGCAELTVTTFGVASRGGRQQSVVSVASGNGRTLTLRIVNENGQTSVSITG